MNAPTLVPQDMTATDGYWIGRFSMLAACEMKRNPVAREALDEFLRSPVPSQWLKESIREELKR